MLSFENDYSYGACPEILDRLARTNDTAFPGYGSDAACEDAKRRIREACETPDADVWFLVGGTQTNQTVIDTMLAPYEASSPLIPAIRTCTRPAPSSRPATR